MSSVSQTFKKQKRKIEALIAMRGHRRWNKHPNALKRVDSFFDSICSGGIPGVTEAFKPDCGMEMNLMRHFEKNLPIGRNRWKHLGCYDDDRVKLTMGPVDYIHANYISTPEDPKRMIATQAPLDKTAADFWYMVLQEEAEIIISLCPVDEKRHEPYFWQGKRADKVCSNYFAKNEGDYYYFNDCHLTVVTCEINELTYEQNGVSAKIYKRDIEIIVKDERQFRCSHYHWVWDQALTENVTSIPIKFLQDLPKTKKPIVIHCRDGVGLTGCFVMFQYYLDLLKADNCERKILPPAKYLKTLREQRHRIVEYLMQFHYINMVLVQYFADEIGKDHQDLEKYEQDYMAYMEGVNLEGVTTSK